MELREISAAVFDLDGTVLDSSWIWDGLGERYLISRGITPAPGLTENIRVMSVERGCEFLRDSYPLGLTSGEIQQGILGMIADFYRRECLLKPGAAELLELLARRGVGISAATAGEKELALAALERLGVLRYFSGIFTCAEYGGKEKPDIFVAASSAPAERTAVFEDSLHAVITAKRAGFITAAVCDSSEPEQALLRETAAYYRRDLSGYIADFR